VNVKLTHTCRGGESVTVSSQASYQTCGMGRKPFKMLINSTPDFISLENGNGSGYWEIVYLKLGLKELFPNSN
jgi:hypothetical protein